jgi:ADP-heptose:LPS heptosyltransferase
MKPIRKVYFYFTGAKNRLVKRSRSAHTHENLIIQFAGLGDACLLISVCRELEATRRLFDILCMPELVPLWQFFFPGRTVASLDSRDWYPGHIRSALQPLDKSYHSVYVSSLHPYAAYIASFFRARFRIGMIENRPYKGSRWILNRLHRVRPDEHVISRYRGLLELPRQPVENSGRLPAGSLNLRDTILIHPGGKWKPRRWPASRYMELVRVLVSGKFRVRVLIHESETDLLDLFTPHTSALFQIAKTVTVRDLIHEIEGCNLFIGNDSGPVHLASLMKKPAVCIWGPGHYERIHPVGPHTVTLISPLPCRPCRQYTPDCPEGTQACLEAITVERVVETIGGMIQKDSRNKNQETRKK